MTLEQNEIVRFDKLTRKKRGIFANFRVKSERGGVAYTGSITVDIFAAELNPSDPLEKIIEECSKLVVKELRNLEHSFEGLANL